MGKIMDKMKAKSDPYFFSYVLFYNGDLGPYENKLKLKDPSKPYIFLLDKTGKLSTSLLESILKIKCWKQKRPYEKINLYDSQSVPQFFGALKAYLQGKKHPNKKHE